MPTTSSATRRIRAACFLLFAPLLAACGGGGGGDTPPPPVDFTADRTSVAFDFIEGTPVAAQDVTITAAGELPGAFYVGATVEGEGIARDVKFAVNGSKGVFSLRPADALVAGEYTGRVLLKACVDSGCAQLIGSSPYAVAYTVRVRPTLKITPNTATLSATSGTGAAQPFTVQLPDGAAAANVAVTAGAEWLTIDNRTATGFTARASSLPSGQYSGTVQVEAAGIVAAVPITYVVAPPPGGDRQLSATPASIALSTVEGAPSPPVTLSVTPPSWNPTVTYSVDYPAGAPRDWLTVAPVPGGYLVTADALDLRAGSFTASLVVSGAWPSVPVVVPVALTVGVSFVRPADESFTLNAETTRDALRRQTPINVVSGPPVNWRATSNATWLEVNNGARRTGEMLEYRFDERAVERLPNAASYTATITITPVRSTMSPVSFDVTLEKRLPEVTSVGPYVHLAGRPLRVVLRGSGFASIANVAGRVAIQGANVQSAERVNDTEIVAQIDALSVGRHRVEVSNALDMGAASSSLDVVAAQPFAAAVVPSGGYLRSLTFDPQRNAVYAANLSLQSVMRFSPSGGASWSSDSVPHPQIYDLGLSHDGTRLLVARSDRTAGAAAISVLDPRTLQTQSTTSLPGSLEPTFETLGFGLKTTNDGRTWLSVGNTWAQMMSFHADTLAVTPFQPQITTSFYSGPWYGMSRDGERLIVVQSAALSPAPPLLYMNAADSTLAVNPLGNGVTFAYGVSVSEDGNRMLLDADVRDRSFNVVGRVVLPTTFGEPPYVALNRQLSHDGTRVYVLAYREDFFWAPWAIRPRVFVFDSSTPQTTQAELPLLGFFDLIEYPTCVPSLFTGDCNWTAITGTISLDSRTLFFAGNANMVVAPVPTTLTPLATSMTISSGQTVAWPSAAE